MEEEERGLDSDECKIQGHLCLKPLMHSALSIFEMLVSKYAEKASSLPVAAKVARAEAHLIFLKPGISLPSAFSVSHHEKPFLQNQAYYLVLFPLVSFYRGNMCLLTHSLLLLSGRQICILCAKKIPS